MERKEQIKSMAENRNLHVQLTVDADTKKA